MCDGYQSTGAGDHSELDDEFLCEYVDGTMDPAVREVFEEYLRANPALAEHVEHLRDTRRLLCQYGCRCQAPQGLQTRLRHQLACEMIRAQRPLFPVATSHLRAAAAFTSAMAMMLVVGMLAGESALSEERRTDVAAGAILPSAESTAGLPDFARTAATRLPHASAHYAYPRYSSFGSFGGYLAPAAASAHPADTATSEAVLRRSDGAP